MEYVQALCGIERLDVLKAKICELATLETKNNEEMREYLELISTLKTILNVRQNHEIVVHCKECVIQIHLINNFCVSLAPFSNFVNMLNSSPNSKHLSRNYVNA